MERMHAPPSGHHPPPRQLPRPFYPTTPPPTTPLDNPKAAEQRRDEEERAKEDSARRIARAWTERDAAEAVRDAAKHIEEAEAPGFIMFHKEDGCVFNFFKLLCYILVGPFVLLYKAVESIPTCIAKCCGAIGQCVAAICAPICSAVSFVCLKIRRCIAAICRSVNVGGGGSSGGAVGQ